MSHVNRGGKSITLSSSITETGLFSHNFAALSGQRLEAGHTHYIIKPDKGYGQVMHTQ